MQNRVFDRFQICMCQFGVAFGQFHKYSSCFSIKTIDQELESIFSRVLLSYAKISTLIQDNEDIENDDEYKSFSTTGFSDSIVDHTLFFGGVNDFLKVNRRDILSLFPKSKKLVKVSNEVKRLETQLLIIQQIVDRMKTMIQSSQQIYQSPFSVNQVA